MTTWAFVRSDSIRFCFPFGATASAFITASYGVEGFGLLMVGCICFLGLFVGFFFDAWGLREYLNIRFRVFFLNIYKIYSLTVDGGSVQITRRSVGVCNEQSNGYTSYVYTIRLRVQAMRTCAICAHTIHLHVEEMSTCIHSSRFVCACCLHNLYLHDSPACAGNA